MRFFHSLELCISYFYRLRVVSLPMERDLLKRSNKELNGGHLPPLNTASQERGRRQRGKKMIEERQPVV